MIIQETFEHEGRMLVRTYSDANRYVVGANGIPYEEAIDPAELHRAYSEGDIIDEDPPTDEDG